MKSKPKPYKKLRLQDNHTWKSPPGFKIVVMDRGAVSFNIPENWVITEYEPFTLRDAHPPDDEAGVQITMWRFPPGIDWTGLPLDKLLTDAMKGTDKDVLEKTPIGRLARTDIEIVWTEHRFIDEKEKREAYSRFSFARGFDVQALFTFSFWVTDAGWCRPIWEEMMRSLQLGRVIQDPTKGETLH